MLLQESLCSDALLQEPEVFVLLVRAHEAETTPVQHFCRRTLRDAIFIETLFDPLLQLFCVNLVLNHLLLAIFYRLIRFKLV